MLLYGSCLCGAIRYEIGGPLSNVINCHCGMCRKAHAAAFRTRASVPAKDFRFISGEEVLSRYESSPGMFRCFCSRCGSSIISTFVDNPDVYGFPLGTLDDDPGVKPVAHVHVASKAPWHEITDDLPRFEIAPD